MKRLLIVLLISILFLSWVLPALADAGQKAGILNYQDIKGTSE